MPDPLPVVEPAFDDRLRELITQAHADHGLGLTDLAEALEAHAALLRQLAADTHTDHSETTI